MNGVKEVYNVQVNIERNSGEFDSMIVRSAVPIIVDVKDFGLSAGVEKLRELAGLKSISTEMPVQFLLVFRRQ